MGVLDSNSAILKPDPTVIINDDFSQGMCGWDQLISGVNPQGPVTLVPYPSGGSWSLCGRIENSSSTSQWNNCTMQKRVSLPYGAKEIKWEAYIAIASYYGSNGVFNAPRAIDIGFDTGWGSNGDSDPNRTFYKFRWLLFDESSGTNMRWQVASGSDGATFVDIDDSVIPYGFNENKRGLIHIEATFDIDDKLYNGLRVNGQGFGRLASSPDNSLRSLVDAPAMSLTESGTASFYGGLNMEAAIVGRTTTTFTAAELYLSNPRATVLS